jgi:hypothetical protein
MQISHTINVASASAMDQEKGNDWRKCHEMKAHDIP